MNDFLKVKVEITNYSKDTDEPFPKVKVQSVFAQDDLVQIGDEYIVSASEIIKAVNLCSHNRW